MKNNFSYAALGELAGLLDRAGTAPAQIDSQGFAEIGRKGHFHQDGVAVRSLSAGYLPAGSALLAKRGPDVAALTLVAASHWHSAIGEPHAVNTLVPATMRRIFRQAGLTEAGTPDPAHHGDTDHTRDRTGQLAGVHPEPGQFVVRTKPEITYREAVSHTMIFFNQADLAKVQETIARERDQETPRLHKWLSALPHALSKGPLQAHPL